MIDSKCNESGLENTSSGFPIFDKQQPIAAKKTALRDSQNDNRVVVPKPLADPSFVNDRGQTGDIVKVSGTKRPTPEGPTSPLRHQSPSSNGVNAQFVYIRRKSEQELIKNNTSDNTNRSVDGPHLKQISHVEQETPRQQTQPTQVQGLKVSTFPAHAPMPMTSLVTFSSGAPSVPDSLGKPVNVLAAAGTNHPTVSSEILPVIFNNPQGKSEQAVNVLSAAETNHLTISSEILLVPVNNPQGKSERTVNVLSAAETNRLTVISEILPVTVNNPQGKSERTVNVLSAAGTNRPTVISEILPVTVNNPPGKNERNWKERFSHLQAFLRNCDQSSQEEYIEMLKNMSPVGRSRHAVELEKRAIHLLLEEGKEIQRMNILNVLGKPLLKNNNSPTSPQVQLGK